MAFLAASVVLAAQSADAGETVTSVQLPTGFVAEVVAGPPLVQHPLMACFDDQGRLYVTDAAGVNLDEKELQNQLPNGIRRLEDTDGDGRFDRSTVFADRMTFPNGGVWHGDSLYVASAPYIWRLRDQDGDGVAEERTKLVGEFGFIGNAADIHGCFIGPEGRLWWCDGRHGHQVRDANGAIISQGESARIFSCRLDGSDFRTHCGGGMDNPVEIDFTPTGDVLGTVNLFYQTRGDCLVHWLPGGRYPRDDQPQCLAEFRRTGDLLGPVLNYGHVAVSGATRYRGDSLGPEYRDGWFVCEFNTHQVNVTRLAPSGSTYAAERADFLRSDNIDFHPTDVLEDADGSLLVIDTGGWFRYGCPTSQVAKPEVAGAIYRIRRADAPRIDDPRGNTIDFAKAKEQSLLKFLGDDRWAVRDRAQQELIRRGEPSIQGLVGAAQSANPHARVLAAWAIHQIRPNAARALIESSDPQVKQVAMRSAGWDVDAQATASLAVSLRSPDAAIRRTAAEALARVGAHEHTSALLDAVRFALDRAEEHALIFAAIEAGDVPALAEGLRSPHPAVQRAALIALEQVSPAAVDRDAVLAMLGSTESLTVREAMSSVAQRADWTSAMPGYWRKWLNEPLDAARAEWLRGALVAFSGDEPTQAFIAERLQDGAVAPAVKGLLLDVVRTSELTPSPATWIAALEKGSRSDDPQLRLAFVRAAASVRDPRLRDALVSAARSAEEPARLAAIRGLAELGAKLDDQNWKSFVAGWTGASDETERSEWSAAFARAELSETQLGHLAAAMAQAQPLELAALLPAFRRGRTSEVGLALVQALAQHDGLAVVPYAEMRAAVSGFPSDVHEAMEKLLAEREVVSEDQQSRLAAFDARTGNGDVERGRALFFGARAACSACHRADSRGGAIGPDLSHIAAIRTRRDLGESVLYPSLTLARGFDTLLTLSTREGLVIQGLVERETSDALYVRTAQRELVRVDRAEIEEQTPSRVSIMPQGFGELLTDAELDDLVAFLLSQR